MISRASIRMSLFLEFFVSFRSDMSPSLEAFKAHSELSLQCNHRTDCF